MCGQAFFSFFPGIDISASQLPLFCVVAGATSHLAFWIHGEKHRYVNHIVFSIAVLPFLVAFAIYRLSHLYPSEVAGIVGTEQGYYSFLQSFAVTVVIYILTLSGLFSSIITYRLFFHKIRSFPGPFWAKVTKFWSLKEQIRSKQHWYCYLRELHERYGDVVRIGPNELSIRHPNISHTLGNFPKATFYDQGFSGRSLITLRDAAYHKQRRKIWDGAFTLPAIQNGYVPRIIQHGHILLEHLRRMAKEGRIVNLTDQFNYYNFDLMGDLAFGKREGFGMLETQGHGSSTFFMEIAQASTNLSGYLLHINWSYRVEYLIQTAIGRIMRMQRAAFFLWSDQLIKDKMVERERERKIEENEGKEKPAGEKDILHYLLEAEYSNIAMQYPSGGVTLAGEARLAVVAASETTSTAFTTLFFHLASSPRHLKAVQVEIDSLYSTFMPTRETPVPKEVIVGGTHSTRILESCINEALRMNPSIPLGVHRIVPSTGLMVGNKLIPPGVEVWYPSYVNFRNPEVYREPDKFLPERWYDPEYADYVKSGKKTDDFVPFWVGRYGCVGKNLALANLRVLTTMILREFDLAVDEGWEGREGEERWYAGARGNFVMASAGWGARLRRRDNDNTS